ncbi:hypothetical protein FUAX_08730 [Fulvitalea axinellae]|uniref:Fe/B12 periplasmic-binding domain-containing protein n=1 Tax=Fulvitalea axinellae TaxID=1182444 RepID=A0AAU9D6I8_9BACT|nr:hypothetical protein FUAX_08730 [Fulvitalea axinellae]
MTIKDSPRNILFVVLATLMFGVSCTGKQDKQRQEKEANVVAKKERIVTIGGLATETVFALGKGQEVLATDLTGTYPAQTSLLPKVGHRHTISAEAILSHAPTVIIFSEGGIKKEIVDQLAGTNTELVVLPSTKTVANTKTAIRQIGKALGAENKVDSLIQTIEQDLDKVKKTEEKARPKVLFIYARGTGSLNIAGKGTFAEEMITLAGGQLAIQEINGFKALTPEALIKANPDCLLFFEKGLASLGGKEKAIEEIPGLKLTTAGKQGRIITMNASLLSSFGPRVGKAAEELNKKLFNSNPI